jgi:hypothetical protein
MPVPFLPPLVPGIGIPGKFRLIAAGLTALAIVTT